ncbi:hypothetical protein GCM10011507_19800 [Edaphobacter acidisoli]|uniref:Methyltransferase domain-containing protein n=1 Tax=Edaphobacter acidisoli TaxID=2040573 RepID=A0A916RTJ5_9BACT|nr:hypothetical protein [Edaphobacter acidisoli]GGA68314.1 hypothetical protein GCM10011507_19800 [Edaphobacter acidisoli]
MSPITEKLKAALWKAYGNTNSPAEWDGANYGGGKLSQRFWEYHQTIELLDLTPDSVVLDIGGGSPLTGAGFFTTVIAPFVREVHVLDMNIGEVTGCLPNIIFHRSLGNYESLAQLLQQNPQITHIASVSVFEHIPDEIRSGIVKAINDCFRGDIFVATLEYHSRSRFFEYQLTTKTLSKLFTPFEQFFPDKIRQSPFWCEDAYKRSFRQRVMRRLFPNRAYSATPLWYPVALRFKRLHAGSSEVTVQI